MRRSIRIVGGLIGLLFVLACVAWSGPKQPVPVSILMPAPYADASTQLVEAFNREHRGTIQLEVSVARLKQNRSLIWPSAVCCWGTRPLMPC
jgi:hypothetical protein